MEIKHTPKIQPIHNAIIPLEVDSFGFPNVVDLRPFLKIKGFLTRRLNEATDLHDKYANGTDKFDQMCAQHYGEIMISCIEKLDNMGPAL